MITDETIAKIALLAKLELSETEREQAKQDMRKMLGYIDLMNELDTAETEPMSHVFSAENVFREDVVVNGDMREEMLANAQLVKDGMFVVPQTFEG
ncbi:MAG: Asp-tRNA(Asn)/Glu-tRNA(Gln) amidotransferase subunit GatC [Lachnospiraceae bacterium]|nr:Asp-tRNA(Asn)/Glu-tRNA(Gln) amidotransferase subunit GatC [Lachnospiraceae bacterium]